MHRGGLLAGKITSVNDSPHEGRFSTKLGAMGSMYRARYLKDGFLEAIPIIKDVAVRRTPEEINSIKPDRSI